MKNKKALIVVDVQLDFCPGGALAVEEGDTIIPVINDLLPKYDLIIFTQDWHPENHSYFASAHPGTEIFDTFEGATVWPDHCVQNTRGADLHPDLNLSKCKKDFYIFKKGIDVNEPGYSAFENTGLYEFLLERAVTEVHICGLATDYCVKETAIDSAMKGYTTYVIKDACKGISSDLTEVLQAFLDAEVYYVDTWIINALSLMK
jgi:nicotinamidase/pyrazinamidase